MTETHKRTRVSSMSTAVDPTVKLEEVEPRVVRRAGGAAAAAATGQAANITQGDDPSRFVLVLVERDRFFHCTACSAPLKLPIYKCDAAGHKVCCTCRQPGARNHCRACNGAAATFTLCSDEFQELICAHKVSCPNKSYGCREQATYLLVDQHQRACPHQPCYCSEPAGCGGFLGSPRMVHDHLVGLHHSWPTTKIEYGKGQPLSVTEPRRLLVTEGGGRVFVLAVAKDEAAGMTNVSLMCLRSSAEAAAGPHFKAWLWSNAPGDPVTNVEERLEVEIVVQSRATPCEIAVREGTLLPLQPKFLRGASSKIVLYVRIEMLKPF
ncbi:unnamed protein product [Alopecurus aequalis]